MATLTIVLISMICVAQVLTTIELCGDQSMDQEQLSCGMETLCYKDKFGNKGCAPKGHLEIPGALCQPERFISVLDESVGDSCDPWHTDEMCPEGSVCCLTQAGHQCIQSDTFEELRQDVDLGLDGK